MDVNDSYKQGRRALDYWGYEWYFRALRSDGQYISRGDIFQAIRRALLNALYNAM